MKPLVTARTLLDTYGSLLAVAAFRVPGDYSILPIFYFMFIIRVDRKIYTT